MIHSTSLDFSPKVNSLYCTLYSNYLQFLFIPVNLYSENAELKGIPTSHRNKLGSPHP